MAFGKRAAANVADVREGTVHYRTVAMIVACALLMQTLDSTVLVIALPTMARDFHVAAPDLSIALTAYLLALAMFIPASGAAADRFGAKPLFQTAIAVFMAGSLACAFATSIEWITLARFVQGMGGAMMMPVGRLLLLRSVAKRDLVSATSWLIMPALIGPIIAPPLGGVIVTYFNWRWIFWINMPIGILGITLVGCFIPDVRDPSNGRFDRRGFLLSAVSLSCLLAGFEMVSHAGGMRTASAFLICGIVAGALYLGHARRVERPILDMTLMRMPTFRLSVIGGSLIRIAQGAQPFLMPLMMQLAFGMTAARAGIITVATAIGSFAMKPLALPILRRFGFRASLIASGLTSSAACFLCGFFRADWPLPAMFGVLLLFGFSVSFQFTAYNTIGYDEVDSQRMSAATSFYATFQQLTLSLGICVGAAALHLSMAAQARTVVTYFDFSIALWTVATISMFALFVNLRFHPDAGEEMSGRSRSTRLDRA
jgi:EmrB/QacA subfamily drug resistance transporter